MNINEEMTHGFEQFMIRSIEECAWIHEGISQLHGMEYFLMRMLLDVEKHHHHMPLRKVLCF